ncbi:MAG TPA: hypothetical protein VFX58_07525 [Chitinophagaceae bacterium]|nr:hypothetical protein [Chitinophagaceae bacterium]
MKPLFVRVSFSLLAFWIMTQAGFSQTISAQDRKKLQLKEDTLRLYAQFMITDSMPEDRMVSDSIFTRTFVRALQIKNSFWYPFDSVFGISRLYAPDSSFRIYTWNLQFDDYYSRQKGAIQMRTRDGSLKLFPLRDVSEFIEKAEDSVRTRANWIGAIYYNIIKTQYKGKNYYTLFGFDHNSITSSKKWIEVLHFNERNEPVFGGPFFTYEQDSLPQKPKHRLSMEFKKDARVLANYISELDMILVDHLISETDQPDLPMTYVPDGDNEGYKWENGKWVHIDKVFTFKLKDGEAPVEDPLMDKSGNKNEEKLKERSDKNKPKNNEQIPINYDN